MDLSTATHTNPPSGANLSGLGTDSGPIAGIGLSHFLAKRGLQEVKLESFQQSLPDGFSNQQDDLVLPQSRPSKLTNHRFLNSRFLDSQTDHKKTISDQSADQLTGMRKDKRLVGAAQLDLGNPDSTIDRTLRATAATPPFPGRLMKYTPGRSLMRGADIRQWQAQMRDRGWSIDVDGIYGPQSARVARQFQAEKGLSTDGIVGRQTWNAAFTLPTAPNPVPGNGGSSGEYLNQRGLNLIKNSEGLRLTAYRDPVGIWTIGYGHTGPEVGPGDRITTAQAEALLRQDLVRFENSVRSLVKVSLNSNQFSALVSFTYNVGSGALSQSTLLRKLNQADYRGSANEFERWVYGDGRKLPGLVRRRAEEKALFLTPA